MKDNFNSKDIFKTYLKNIFFYIYIIMSASLFDKE